MIITITRPDVAVLNTYLATVKQIVRDELPGLVAQTPAAGEHKDFSGVDFLDLETALQAKFNPEAVTFTSCRNDTLKIEVHSVVFERFLKIVLRYVKLYAKTAAAIKMMVDIARPLFESVVKPRLEATAEEMDSIQEDAMAFAVWVKVKDQDSETQIH